MQPAFACQRSSTAAVLLLAIAVWGTPTPVPCRGSGNIAFVTVKGSGVLAVFDIAEATAPRRIAVLASPGYANDLFLSSTHLYISDGLAGLMVVDVSDPASPVEVARLDTAGYVHDTCVAGEHIFMVAGDAGLFTAHSSGLPLVNRVHLPATLRRAPR